MNNSVLVVVVRAGLRLSIVLLAVAASLSSVAVAQQAVPADPLAPVSFLVGRWTTTSEGEPGQGAGQREYTRVLGGRFIQGTSRVTYPPQPKNPKGETHEDLGFFSFDRARKQIVFRQFHVEGFVTQYGMDASTTAGTVVFSSQSIENIPAGFRARETCRLISADEIEEVFEMAEPGKDFTVYSRTRLRRAR
jgi:hypothetical protein